MTLRWKTSWSSFCNQVLFGWEGVPGKNVFFFKYTMPSWWCSWANVCSCHIWSVSPSIKVNKKKSLEPPFGLWTHQMLQTFRANILLFLVTSSWWRTQVISDPLKKIGAFRLVLGRVVLVATKMLSTCWSLFFIFLPGFTNFWNIPKKQVHPRELTWFPLKIIAKNQKIFLNRLFVGGSNMVPFSDGELWTFCGAAKYLMFPYIFFECSDPSKLAIWTAAEADPPTHLIAIQFQPQMHCAPKQSDTKTHRNMLIEGSLNRNFRQYGQLKSRVE